MLIPLVSQSVYFLDAYQAETQALAMIDQALAEDKTLADIPLCYYHAEQKLGTDAPNCVWLPLEKLYDFFQYSNLPLPERIHFSGALQFLEQDGEFVAEINAMLMQIQQRRDQLSTLYLASPLDRDGLFFDGQVALLTAVRRATVMRNGIAGTQRCYYLGQKLPVFLDNLIHIDLDHYVSFFASSVHQPPKVIIPAVNMSEQEIIEAEMLLKQFNQLVTKHKCVG